MIVLLAFLVMLALFAINVPVAFAISAASFTYFFVAQDMSAVMVIQRMVGTAENLASVKLARLLSEPSGG